MSKNEKPEDAVWPMPQFVFEVDFGENAKASFHEVSGLDTDYEVIDYRAGTDRTFSSVKMPGIRKFSNVTLKRGLLTADSSILNWFKDVQFGAIQRRDVVIRLLDQKGQATVTWKLTNVWPVKFLGAPTDSNSNEVAIEVVELAYEGLTINNE